jgi:hypothetical protein
MCFDFLYNFCLEHFSFCEELSSILSKIYNGRRVKCRYSCQSLDISLLYRFSKNPQISDFMKIHPVEAEMFHADGRTRRS